MGPARKIALSPRGPGRIDPAARAENAGFSDFVNHAPGQSIDRGFLSIANERFGYDFTGVRVHTGEQAAKATGMLHARAIALSSHIAFADGEYRPGSADGQQLLAHELAHVVQQSRGGNKPDLAPGNTLDAAAHRAAAQFASGAVEVDGACAIGPAREALASVDVTKLSADALEAAAQRQNSWLFDHLPDDPAYDRELSLAIDIFVEMSARGGVPASAAQIESMRSFLVWRSPRTIFERRIKRGELPQWRQVAEKGEIIGYMRSSGGYTEIVDLDGKFVSSAEIGLETPLIDPIDLIPFELIGSLVAKAGVIGLRAAAKVAVRVVAKDAAKVVVEEGAKVGTKAVASGAATTAVKDLTGAAARDVGKTAAADVGKTAAADVGKTAAADVGKTAAADVGKTAAADVGKAVSGDVGKTGVEALVQVFRRGKKVRQIAAVSLKRLRNVLGRAGVSPSGYKLVKVSKTVAAQMEKEAGTEIWGWISRDGAGAVVTDASGRPIINFTTRGLSSLEQAVKTFGHEAKHLKDFAAGLLESSEALAELEGEKLWTIVSETVGK
jgi:hypothetical protein